MITFPNKQCEICKVFSNGSRVNILLALRDKPCTVSELIEKTGLNQSVVSQHLAILRNKSIVEAEKNGAWITYRLKYPEIMKAFDIMREIAKKISGGTK
ncbi:MAG: metalloregulator ArsR/SmtB family transcription factor [Nanoarchaeota archaeon]|nr:metalloregulator ArsR/SmtB family transcription factor [Nanoarchaeota archaeon]